MPVLMNTHHGPSAVMRTSFSLIDGGPLHPAMGHDNGPLSSKTSGTEVHTSQTTMPTAEIGRLGSMAQREGKDRFCHTVILWRLDPAEKSQDYGSGCPGTAFRTPRITGHNSSRAFTLLPLQGPVWERRSPAGWHSPCCHCCTWQPGSRCGRCGRIWTAFPPGQA